MYYPYEEDKHDDIDYTLMDIHEFVEAPEYHDQAQEDIFYGFIGAELLILDQYRKEKTEKFIKRVKGDNRQPHRKSNDKAVCNMAHYLVEIYD